MSCGFLVQLKTKNSTLNTGNQGGVAMTCNVGNIERAIRIALGVALVAAGYFAELPTAGAMGAYFVGVIALATGVVGFCPAWKLLGINTCPTNPSAKS